MRICVFIFLLCALTSCKEISVDDITADNYEEILEKSEDHPLDKYPIGLEEFSYILPPRLRALEIDELRYPWKLYKSASDDKVRRTVVVANEQTDEHHLLSFVNNSFVHFSFEKLSDQRFAEYLRLLAKFGYTYKNSALRDGNDIIVKKVEKNTFVVVINDLHATNRLIFDIYSKK